jgi:hypothetical protein
MKIPNITREDMAFILKGLSDTDKEKLKNFPSQLIAECHS